MESFEDDIQICLKVCIMTYLLMNNTHNVHLCSVVKLRMVWGAGKWPFMLTVLDTGYSHVNNAILVGELFFKEREKERERER